MKLVVVTFLALLFCPAAQSAHPNSRLNSLASEIAGRPVTATCYDNPREWVAVEQANHVTYDADAFSYQDGRTFLSPLVCDTLEALMNYPAAQVGAYWASRAIKVFIHEAEHQTGLVDEHLTDCAAISLLPKYAPVFGFPQKITQVSYVRSGKLYKRVTKLTVNPAYTSLLQWANYWHSITPGFGGTCESQ